MAEAATLRVVVGYDGSVAAGSAIADAAVLIPAAEATITHLWVPPFASESLRRRLWRGTGHLDEFVAAVEHEGQAEAERVAAMGVAMARAAGWTAEPLVHRSYGGEGLQLAQLAENLRPDLVVLGSRGLTGVRAVLGSVSDMVVHYSPRPVLTLPYPLLSGEREALPGGPVLVGWDGSPGADHALAAARRLFRDRSIVLGMVHLGKPAWPAPPEYKLVTAEPSGSVASGRMVAEALTKLAAEQDAAAVVVGTRGQSALREIVLGSVAKATLHHCTRPVIVVPR